ncbi:MAG: protocatechuate 3,4-dioxygenase subunit alpha [Candidatus Acidiferrales bacterium]
MSRIHTPSQTVGPFFHLGLRRFDGSSLAPEGTPSNQIISIHGRVFDADLNPVPDAMLEVWQSNANGEYYDRSLAAHASAKQFTGFGRIPTDDNGAFQFTTIKPGAVRGCDGGAIQSPHIVVTIFMRGLLRHLSTRIYFPHEALNASDPVLRLIPEDRRSTLIAQSSATEPAKFDWNVVLQGENETVFFDL